jgi:hypothetical protein
MEGKRIGPGEAQEKARWRRAGFIILLCAIAGFIPGFFVGYTDVGSLFDDSTDWPPFLAIGGAVTFLAAVLAGGFALQRQYDEMQRMMIYQATSVGASAYALGYPVWFFLWKGGFAPEPMHGILFLAFYLSLFAAATWLRLKS